MMKPTVLVFLLLICRGAAFGSPRQNTTLLQKGKSVLYAPLRVDVALGLVKDEEDAPKGVVINAGVGSLVAAGGIIGYVTKGSKASLMAGGTFGGLLIVSAVLIKKGKRIGNQMGAVIASMLTYVMGKKFIKSGKFMPAGLIAGMAGASFLYNTMEGFFVNKEKEVPADESPTQEAS